MKAVVKIQAGYDNVEVQNIQEPSPGPRQVKIKVAYTGICGSDIHTFKGEYNSDNLPVVLGHEFSGEVVEVGEGVKHLKVGDRVTSETTYEVCEHCRYCLEKDYNLCSNRKGIGTQVNGSMAEYVISREESCHVLPDNVSYKAASLMEPLSCCTHALMEKTYISADDTVLIVGPGPIGLLAAQVALAEGATVILSGITNDRHRLKFAKEELGVDYIVDAQAEDLSKIILEITDGYGVDQVIECSGSSIAANQALKLTAKKGTFVQVGLFPTSEVAIDMESVIQREIEVVGSRSQKPSSWDKSLKLLERGKVDAEKLITHEYSLDEWRQGFEKVMDGSAIKVVLKS